MVSVFDYLDYREYLKEYIEEKKKSNSGYSIRLVASKLECDPGFFNRVIRGERRLTPEYQLRIASLFKLSPREKEYFELLCGYNQARKDLEKDHYYTRLKQFKNSRFKQVSEEQYGLYDEWYNIVLRDLLNVYPITDITPENCARLGRKMQPKIQGSTIQHSLERLLELGIIHFNSEGLLALKDRIISTGTTIPPEIVRRILRQFFQLGTTSLTRFSPEERVCSAVTVSVSSGGYEKIKAKLEQTRKEILEIAQADSEVESVYHMNIQLFPVSK